MKQCEKCGENIAQIYQCPDCGDLYCKDHKESGYHTCTQLIEQDLVSPTPTGDEPYGVKASELHEVDTTNGGGDDSPDLNLDGSLADPETAPIDRNDSWWSRRGLTTTPETWHKIRAWIRAPFSLIRFYAQPILAFLTVIVGVYLLLVYLV